MRIIVAGDSTAVATGGGLVAWAAANPDLAQVEIVAELGCGFVRGGEMMVLEWTPVGDRCDEWLDETLPARVEALAPDVVMLMTTSWDVLDRRWPETGEVVPTDPAYRERIVRDVADVSNRLGAAGSRQGRVGARADPERVLVGLRAGTGGSGAARRDLRRDGRRRRVERRTRRGRRPPGLAPRAGPRRRPGGTSRRRALVSRRRRLRIADEFLGEQLIRAALAPDTDGDT